MEYTVMTSTLQPPRKHRKDKKHKQKKKDLKHNESSSKSSKSSKKRKDAPLKMEVSSLYTEDIGLVGVKRAKVGPSSSSGPILKGPEGQKFQISETSEERLRRLRRKNRFDKEGGSSKPPKSAPPPHASSIMNFAKKPQAVQQQRLMTREPDFLSKPLSSGRKAPLQNNNNTHYSQHRPRAGQLVGTNTNIEKPYFRLTTYVKPENVRPIEILVKSLAHIKSKYFQEEDFEWANEQLKSVRQDITVQRLRNRFVLDVYETHARILLEHGDLSEFNQCQTMIRYLTSSGVEPEDAGLVDPVLNLTPRTVSSSSSDNDDDATTAEALVQSEESADEFRAYHVIYSLVQDSWEDLTKALIRVRDIVRGHEEDISCNKTTCSRHSLEVVKSVTHNDYRAFFKLYQSAPHMSAYLMDFLVKRMREKAYERIIAAYRPTICVEYFRGTLCFHDIEETRLFLRQMNAVFVKGEKPPLWVDCKASSGAK